MAPIEPENHLPGETERPAGAPLEEPTSSEGALDFMWQTFSNLNEWVRFSDAKAAAVLATDGVIVGALVSVLVGSRPDVLNSRFALIWITAIVIAASYSAAYALLSLMPQLKLSVKKRQTQSRDSDVIEEVDSSEESSSLVFFMDIEKKFPTSKEFHDTIQRSLAQPDRAVRELTQQVWANSAVAAVKYTRVSRAIGGLLVAAFLGFGGAIALAVYLLLKVN